MRDNHGLAVTKLWVGGSTRIGTNDYSFWTQTDMNGYYQAGLGDGLWKANLDCYGRLLGVWRSTGVLPGDHALTGRF